MATQDDLRTIAGKALADPEFRQKLSEDPEAAVQEMGIELSEEQMKALKEMDKEQFEQGMADLDKRLTMGCWGQAVGIIEPISPESADVTPIPVPETVCAWA